MTSVVMRGRGGDQMMGVFLFPFLSFFKEVKWGGGVLIPCRIKRTDVGKLINKSSGDVEARRRINTQAAAPHKGAATS